MKSSCIDIGMLAAYIGKTISDKEREQMERHLAECDDCRDDFLTANILLNDKELSEWEPPTEPDPGALNFIKEVYGREPEWELPTEPDSGARAFIKKMATDDKESTQGEDNAKPMFTEKMAMVYEWITAPLSELTLQPAFAGVRSQDEPSATYIRLVRTLDDLEMEIRVEKVDTDKVCIYVRILKGMDGAKNIRLKLMREGGGRISRLLKKESEPFDNLSFGSYHMILVQNSQKKGEFYFGITETGLHERKDLMS